jgi:glycosyltransferase involved in cell wall biosynthesis
VIAAHSTWNWTAVAAREQLAEVGVNARVLAAFYASVEHEQSAKNKGALVRSNPIRRLLYSLALAWVRAVAAPAEGRGYRRADVVVLSYENVRRLLAQAHGPNPRVRRIAYCAPLAFRPDAAFVERPLADSGAAPLILTVSRHSPRKGLDVLIRALAQLRDRGVPFRAEVVGRGVLLGAHRQLVRELGLEAHVAVPGGVPDPLPYLRTCEVFVLPTTAEDSGSVSVLEAMQVGAPIVASAVDGLPEDLTHDDNALLVPPSDVPALAEALTRLLGDDELRRRLSRASRATYEARFTPERAAADFARACMDLGLSPLNPAPATVTGE